MKSKKKNTKSTDRLSKLISRFMILVIALLLVLIVLKICPDLKSKVFSNNINLSGLNALYTEYFGGILPISKTTTETVSKETIKYSGAEKYKDGVKLTVTNDYTVMSQSTGLIIYAGEKEGYGNTIIVQRPDGVEVWYANLKNANVSLYDYVKQDQILGTVSGADLYMVFSKDGKYLDYKKYL